MTAHFTDCGAMLQTLKPDEPVYAVRPHALHANAAHFLENFTGDILYAVKCNPDPLFLQALYDGGIRHFDVASLKEAAAIATLFPDAYARFMHPVKTARAIHEAHESYGIDHFALDHADELDKILTTLPGAKLTLIVRLAMPRKLAIYDLGGKYGCSVPDAALLLRRIAAAGHGTGLCFHVGSQCLDPEAYKIALSLVGDTIRAAAIIPDVIDTGGGFPVPYLGTTPPPLDDYMEAIREGLISLPIHPHLRLLCEPGRALAAAGASLVVKVELRRDHLLYVNDGLYGGLGELRWPGLEVPMRVWREIGETFVLHDSPRDPFAFCGPTCDSSDLLHGPFPLPADIRAGDYIEIGQMGAYSLSQRSDFNGFFDYRKVIVEDEPYLP